MTDLAGILSEGMPGWQVAAADGWCVEPHNDSEGARIVWGESTLPLDLPHVLSEWPENPAQIASRMQALASCLRPGEHSVSATTLVEHFPAFVPLLVNTVTADRLGAPMAWQLAVRLTEACLYLTQEAERAADPRANRLLPLLHRARFLLLSAPEREPAGGYLVTRAFGNERVFEIRAQQAREEWALDLLNHEDHPVLREWRPEQLDREFRRLVFVHDAPEATRRARRQTRKARRQVLRLPGEHADGGNDDAHSFVAWIVREGFLPRFMLRDSWTAISQTTKRWNAWLALLLIPPLLAPTVVAATTDLMSLLTGAATSTATAYALVPFLTLGRRELAYLCCLRLPAGAAIGLVALLTFPKEWVQPRELTWLGTALFLTAASYGYLLIEAVAHGVPRKPAVRRAGLVTALGFAHAVAVTALVFAFVVPALTPELHVTISGLSTWNVSKAVALAASAGLSAGVFLQVLWDDRPVTYPLTHLPWKGRGRS